MLKPKATETKQDNNGYAVYSENLTRKFGSFTAVDNINLAVKHGEIFGFLGANGAGKTTAIRMFCGLLNPTSGNAKVDGYDIGKQAEKVKHKIGYMSQKFSLYDDLTVEENLNFYGGVYGLPVNTIQKRSLEVLETLGLTDIRKRLTASVPLGWKQRLALASAIIHKPKILFLDEPTGGVDPLARRNFWDIIYKLADEGTTIFVTTHYMDEAEYCQRVSIMVKGAIIALDTPGELKRSTGCKSMQDVFLKLVAS